MPGGGIQTINESRIKDDSDLFEIIRQEKTRRQALGLPDRPGKLSDVAALKARWQEMRQARATRRTYHIVIEPSDGLYRAYPLAVPQVVAQGETPQAAKEKVAEALRTYLLELLAQGKPLPVERKLVDTIAISLT